MRLRRVNRELNAIFQTKSMCGHIHPEFDPSACLTASMCLCGMENMSRISKAEVDGIFSRKYKIRVVEKKSFKLAVKFYDTKFFF